MLDIVWSETPAKGGAASEEVIDLTGRTEWEAPPGRWTLSRFGYTTQGTYTQPNQREARGFECDKMSRPAVEFHVRKVLGDMRRHLGDLVGTGLRHVLLDNYEAGSPTWTPRMPEEFAVRRVHDLLPFPPTFAGRTIGGGEATRRFKRDFERTIRDLYRDVYFPTVQRLLPEAGVRFVCEPYGGTTSANWASMTWRSIMASTGETAHHAERQGHRRWWRHRVDSDPVRAVPRCRSRDAVRHQQGGDGLGHDLRFGRPSPACGASLEDARAENRCGAHLRRAAGPLGVPGRDRGTDPEVGDRRPLAPSSSAEQASSSCRRRSWSVRSAPRSRFLQEVAVQLDVLRKPDTALPSVGLLERKKADALGVPARSGRRCVQLAVAAVTSGAGAATPTHRNMPSPGPAPLSSMARARPRSRCRRGRTPAGRPRR